MPPKTSIYFNICKYNQARSLESSLLSPPSLNIAIFSYFETLCLALSSQWSLASITSHIFKNASPAQISFLKVLLFHIPLLVPLTKASHLSFILKILLCWLYLLQSLRSYQMIRIYYIFQYASIQPGQNSLDVRSLTMKFRQLYLHLLLIRLETKRAAIVLAENPSNFERIWVSSQKCSNFSNIFSCFSRYSASSF